jgi:capsular exopolysaccharide synthesis family protein
MDFKKAFFKYLQFWPWFLLGVFLSLVAAVFYLNMVQPVYQTTALININKEEEKNTEAIVMQQYQGYEYDENPMSAEIMLITSNDFLEKVVRSLNLNIQYLEKGYIQSTISEDVPFVVIPTISNDSLASLSYDIKISKQGYTLTNPSSNESFAISNTGGVQSGSRAPFRIQWTSKKKRTSYLDKEYSVSLESTASATGSLKAAISVTADKNAKGSLILNHSGTNATRSRAILNKLIILLDENIIINKKKLSTNTVSFLNQRISDFSKEKDSIETVKERYLQSKDILVLETYIADKTQDKTLKKEVSLQNEKQISLTKFAIKELRKLGSTAALGTDYHLEEPTINQLLSQYNATVLEAELLLQRAQKNNPAYLNVLVQLKTQKQLIMSSLDSYLNLLNKTNTTNQVEQRAANSEANSIPTKDKILGNLNSNLSMKEGIYILLLQNRETAILNGAVVESNLKLLNAPQTNYSPIFPKKKPFLIGAFLLGLLLPLSVLYIRLQLDTKIHNEQDLLLQISDAAFLGTIPQVDPNEKLSNGANSRSAVAEATRSLFSNISYLLPTKKDGLGHVILFTSSIKGEGKSFSAFHNALTMSSLNKKVLLIGADLRNPQLHDYFKVEKSTLGLSNFLANKNLDWKSFLKNDANYSENLDILFSGAIPPNPAQLLTNTVFDLLIEEARTIYDFIIIDSAPVQMVSDTLNFSYLADVTVFITRASFSDTKSLLAIKNLMDKGQLKNLGFVINGINAKKGAYGYNYGYLYNYGYDYGMERTKKPWYKIGK